MLLTYEWTHHLIHSSYRPRHRYYRSIWRAHRLHHYRNEHYWFGVTVNLADHVLRTFPARDEVPLSPTARSLGTERGPPTHPALSRRRRWRAHGPRPAAARTVSR